MYYTHQIALTGGQAKSTHEYQQQLHSRPPASPVTTPHTPQRTPMNAETITATAELINATTLATTAILPYTHHLPQGIAKFIHALRNLVPTPHGRHRQGRARHTK